MVSKTRRLEIARKAGKVAGAASEHCRGKKGSAFQTCRTRYFKAQRAKAKKKR